MESVTPASSDRVVVAELVRTRGLRGELVARSQTDVPGRFEQLREATARLKDGTDVPVQLSKVWRHKDAWVVQFTGIDSIEAAERFRGADLWVPFAGRAQLADGEFFRSDLTGCRLVNAATGEAVGVVEDWQQHGGGVPLMEVRGNDRSWLIPFVAALCQVDLQERTIRADLPEGLLDL